MTSIHLSSQKPNTMHSLDDIRAAGREMLPQIRRRHQQLGFALIGLGAIPLISVFVVTMLMLQSYQGELPSDEPLPLFYTWTLAIAGVLMVWGFIMTWRNARPLDSKEADRFYAMLSHNIKEGTGVQEELCFEESVPFITGETDFILGTHATKKIKIDYTFCFIPKDLIPDYGYDGVGIFNKNTFYYA